MSWNLHGGACQNNGNLKGGAIVAREYQFQWRRLFVCAFLGVCSAKGLVWLTGFNPYPIPGTGDKPPPMPQASCQDGLCGYVDANGKLVAPRRFTQVEPFATRGPALGLARVGIGGKWGVINAQGEEIIPVKYDYVHRFDRDGLAQVAAQGKVGLVNAEGKSTAAVRYDEMQKSPWRGWISVSLNGKWGLLDEKGNEVIPLRFNAPFQRSSYHGLARTQLDGRTLLLTRQGQEIQPPDFAMAERFACASLLPYARTGKGKTPLYGYVDQRGIVAIEPRFMAAKEFSQGLAAVEIDSKWGYVDTKGQLAIAPRFASAGAFASNHLALVGVENGREVYIDNKGNEVSPRVPAGQEGNILLWDGWNSPENRTYAACQGKNCTSAWEVYCEPDAWPLLEHLFAGSMPNMFLHVNKCGLKEATGKTVIKPQFDKLIPFAKNSSWPVDAYAGKLTLARKNGRWLYIDRQGKETTLVYPAVDKLKFMENGLATATFIDPLSQHAFYGLVDKQGKVQVLPLYLKIGSFAKNGLAAVNCFYGGMEYIDKNGTEAIPCEFRETTRFADNGAAWVNTQYEHQGHQLVKQEGWFEINENGKPIGDGK
jgi:hypothetical protein